MVKLTALRTITGAYGTAHEGQSFEVSEEDAVSLESRGLAERYREKQRIPVHDISAFKMHLPAENKMIQPERNKKRA